MQDLNIKLTIKSNQLIAKECHKIIFEKPKGFIYNPGDWVDIRFPIPEFPIGHTFSFASSPTESDVIIGFKKGVSKFKQALQTAKIGQTMLITQYGSNGFTFDKRYESVFIAGGIGITPFRSMIKEIVDTKSKVVIELIYLNRDESFPFKQDFDKWKTEHDYGKIYYITTEKEGRLNKEKLKKIIPDIINKKIYIAGPPIMITKTEEILTEIKIENEQIKTDIFDGYES